MEVLIEGIKAYPYPIFALLAVGVISICYNVIRMKKIKASNENFLAEHPDAAKVYLTNKALLVSESVIVHAVNHQTPQHFLENGKPGIYVLPGRSAVSVSYSHTRPGVLHKTVTTSTDIVEKILETEPRKTYILGFDRKEKCFTFEECGE